MSSPCGGLHRLSMPQWVEEGLAQVFDREITGAGTTMLSGEMAQRHKQYWAQHGLEAFWSGEGFSRAGGGSGVELPIGRNSHAATDRRVAARVVWTRQGAAASVYRIPPIRTLLRRRRGGVPRAPPVRIVGLGGEIPWAWNLGADARVKLLSEHPNCLLYPPHPPRKQVSRIFQPRNRHSV